MMSQSRREWDPMKADYDNSNYESQFPDDSSSDLVRLDHRRLYVTNIPMALNDEGLRAAFAKFGTLTEVFVSRDPSKRYGLVAFETPAEARHAMMKLNKTEPLRLTINIAHEKKVKENHNRNAAGRNAAPRDRDGTEAGPRDVRDRSESVTNTVTNNTRRNNSRKAEEMANGDNFIRNDDSQVDLEHDLSMDNIDLELERLQLQRLKIQQEEVACKQRMLLKEQEKRMIAQSQPSSRCVLPDGKVVLRNTGGSIDQADSSFACAGAGGAGNVVIASGAGDSKKKERANNMWEKSTLENRSSSSASTCKDCSERTFEVQSDVKDKSDKKYHAVKKRPKTPEVKPSEEFSRKSNTSKTTELTIKKSDYSKYSENVSRNATPIKSVARSSSITRRKLREHRSELSVLKYNDLFSDTEDEADETNRLIQLRNTDYMSVVDDQLKIVIALAGYPKSKIRLRQMANFKKCLSEVMDMQMKAGLLKKEPAFLDYYLNKGALVCICKDLDTRDWMVRINSGLQERMLLNFIMLKAKVKRLCLAILKIPRSSWPASAQETFKFLQYFNPTLKTDLWKIYSQKNIDDIEVTSFLIDRVSGEIIRGPAFKNILDYREIEFELTGFTEIYFESLLSDLEEDLSSIASRVKLLEEIKSENSSPRDSLPLTDRKPLTLDKRDISKQDNAAIVKSVLESSLHKDMLKKLNDVKHISDKEEVVNWSDEANISDRAKNDNTYEERMAMSSNSGVATEERIEYILESTENLTISRNSNLNIDSNRGIAYHRRTNYLHVDKELKIAITLKEYPQDKLEGTHIRRLKHLFKEYLHKDIKNKRFTNLIVPKFQDIYLSNGAVIYICDSLETKDYLFDIMPKMINSTGLKLVFRDIQNLVRYTRVVMRLPKEHANLETVEILLKLQAVYPGLKPNCWKYYSNIAGKQKRQFGVDPESLEVIKSPNFDPTYQGEKISFRIIDRQKRDMSFDEPINTENKKTDAQLLDYVHKNMFVNPEMSVPLTKIRTNHYSDIVADDLKLYLGPASYPECRIDDALFNVIKRSIEDIAVFSLEKGKLNQNEMPKFTDMYLFDGVIFIICQDMYSRCWIEENLTTVNMMLGINLKATEFRGAVGIISMVVRTDLDTDGVISILQNQNPRLRTKFWRKISTVRTKTKLDVVLQIDKLSAQVMTSPGFNKYVNGNPIVYKLGHLQSLIKPESSLEKIINQYNSATNKPVRKTKSKLSMKGPKNKKFDQLIKDLRNRYPTLKVDDWNMLACHEKSTHRVCDLEVDEATAKLIENEDFKLSVGNENLFFTVMSPRSGDRSHRLEAESMPSVEPDTARTVDLDNAMPENNQDLRKMILKIPMNILPDHRDDLNIIFDLLEDKNPGLNTELWTVCTDSPYPSNGKFTIIVDRQSASIIEGKHFDSTVGGEKLRFYF